MDNPLRRFSANSLQRFSARFVGKTETTMTENGGNVEYDKAPADG